MLCRRLRRRAREAMVSNRVEKGFRIEWWRGAESNGEVLNWAVLKARLGVD